MALMLSSIDSTAVSVAFPVITASFGVSIVLAGWILSGYHLSLTVALPIAGKISDVLGRKSTFIMFLVLFTIGSFLCSIAPNAESLIAFRILQGLGGSGFLPSATGIVATQFPNSRQQAIGLFSTINPFGMIVGPNLGAWLTSAFGWRSIFWINIPLGIAIMVAALILLPSSKREKTHLDLPGAGLFAGALVALMVGLSLTGSAGGASAWVLVGMLLAGSAVCIVFFARRETRVKDAFIDTKLLADRPFAAANIYNFVFGGIFGAVSLVPLYAVSIYGMSTLESGLILTPRSIGMMAASLVVSFMLVRWGYRRPMLVGTIIVIVCFVLLVTEAAGIAFLLPLLGATPFLLVTMGVMGLGIGTAAPAANNACIELMPERVGTISSIRGVFRQSGSVLGITIGSLLLHFLGLAAGFQVFFIGMAAAITVFMLPTIFAMPRSAKAVVKAVPVNHAG